MKKSFVLPALVGLVFCWCAAFVAQHDRVEYAETITAADLRAHLSILASDEYEGRETCKPGQRKSAEYIAACFSKFGIPAQKDGTWFQEVSLIKISGGNSVFSVTNGEVQIKTFQPQNDYYYMAATPTISIAADEIIFAGYGIDDKKYSDFKSDKSFYKDKVLMILDGEPINKGVYTLTGKKTPGVWTGQRRKKNMTAMDLGVKALIVVHDDYAKSKEYARHKIEGYSLILDQPEEIAERPMPVLYVTKEVANSILSSGGSSSTVEKLKDEINSSGKTHQETISTRTTIDIKRNEEKLKSENVLGYIEGSDLKDELVVVTAHYDHLGKEGDVVFNGADDDGSGTVAVVELAEAFAKAKKDGAGPRRSMLFMTVTGEEKGLLGSSWYTNHPVYPMGKTMCNLNIDMIGRTDEAHSKDSNFVYVIGSDKISKDLKKITEQANNKYTKLKLDYRFDDEKDPNMFYYRSDHYNFARKGIPVAFFFNGVHSDYHKETDEVSKINFRIMEKRARLVFYTAWELVNRDEPLKINKKIKK